MPKFRFRVRGEDGQVRIGSLSGPDRDSVQANLEKEGYTILELSPWSSTGEISYKESKGGFSGLVFERPQRAYVPTLGQRIEGLMAFSRQTQQALLLACALLSAVWFVLAFQSDGSEGTAPGGYQQVEILISGRISSPLAKDSYLLLKLEEIPFQKTFAADDVVMSDGAYRLNLAFQSQVRPTRAKLEVIQPNLQPKASLSFLLTGEPLSGTPVLDL